MQKRRKYNIVRKFVFLFWEFVDIISSKGNSEDPIKIRKPVKFLQIVSSGSRKRNSEDFSNGSIKSIRPEIGKSRSKSKATGTI